MPLDEVHAEADRLEHVLSEELEARIDAALGYPTHDPHGHPIPDAELRLDAAERRSLSEVAPGESTTVVRVPDRDAELLRYLASSSSCRREVEVVARAVRRADHAALGTASTRSRASCRRDRRRVAHRCTAVSDRDGSAAVREPRPESPARASLERRPIDRTVALDDHRRPSTADRQRRRRPCEPRRSLVSVARTAACTCEPAVTARGVRYVPARP